MLIFKLICVLLFVLFVFTSCVGEIKRKHQPSVMESLLLEFRMTEKFPKHKGAVGLVSHGAFGPSTCPDLSWDSCLSVYPFLVLFFLKVLEPYLAGWTS